MKSSVFWDVTLWLIFNGLHGITSQQTELFNYMDLSEYLSAENSTAWAAVMSKQSLHVNIT
jgi:hypothetical protein